MTTTPPSPAASQQAAIPTFADYVPVVSAAVTDGTRKAYGSYWNRVTEQWGARRLDEPTSSEIRQLMAYVRAHVVRRSAILALLPGIRCGQPDLACFQRYAAPMLAEKEFFIRKAIGWVLRELARPQTRLGRHLDRRPRHGDVRRDIPRGNLSPSARCRSRAPHPAP
jgi:hypothetical protein